MYNLGVSWPFRHTLNVDRLVNLTCLNFNFGGSELWSCHLLWKKPCIRLLSARSSGEGPTIWSWAQPLRFESSRQRWGMTWDDSICHELLCEMPGMHLVYALSLSCYHVCVRILSARAVKWPFGHLLSATWIMGITGVVDHPKPQLKNYKNTWRNARFSTIQRSRNCPKLIQQSISPFNHFHVIFQGNPKKNKPKSPKILEKIRKNPRDVPFPHWKKARTWVESMDSPLAEADLLTRWKVRC